MLRRIFVLFTFLTTLLLFTAPLHAESTFGWCEVGNRPAVISNLTSTLKYQQSFPACTVTVYITGTINKAVLYSNIINSPLANPFTANANGSYQFYVANGHYDIVLSGAGFPLPLTIANVAIGTTTNDCTQYAAGSSASVVIAACMTALPSTGGIADARSIITPNNWTTCPFDGITKPVSLLMSPSVASVAVSCTVPLNIYLVFDQATILSMATTRTLTIHGPMSIPLSEHLRHADAVTVNSTLFSIDATTHPEWWGALTTNDDWSAIQWAINAARAGQRTDVELGYGNYHISKSLIISAGASSFQFHGKGYYPATIISWSGGVADKSPIAVDGIWTVLGDFAVENLGTGWIAAIDYGYAAAGFTSHGRIDNVGINCHNLPGNGIDLGNNGGQADMLMLMHPYIQLCSKGAAIATHSGNTLSINIYAPTIGTSGTAIAVGNTTNLNVYGGEIDENDINFTGGCNTECLFSGIRSEGSKRTFYSSAGSYQQNVKLENYIMSSNNTSRLTTTAAMTNGSTAITFSVASYIPGDAITVAGADVASGTLHAVVQACSSQTQCNLNAAAGTTVSAGSVALDSTVQAYTFYAQSGLGNYSIQNCVFNGTGMAIFNQGTMNVQESSWYENIPTPFGPYVNQFTGNATSLNNIGSYSGGVFGMPNQIRMEAAGANSTLLSVNAQEPSVFGHNKFRTANTVDTVIDNFTNGYVGQHIYVFIGDTKTLISGGGNIRFAGYGETFPLGLYGTYEFLYDTGSYWNMVSSGVDGYMSAGYLGTCDSSTFGKMVPLTDSNTGTIGATISGTGAFKVMAFCNATNWVVGMK